MKVKNIIVAALLGLGVQVASADQVRGSLVFVGAVPTTLGDVSNIVMFAMDTQAQNFMDWDVDPNDPTTGFAVKCSVPYVGAVAQLPLTSDAYRQTAALLASANATGQEVVVGYNTVVDANSSSGFTCHLDWAMVVGAQ